MKAEEGKDLKEIKKAGEWDFVVWLGLIILILLHWFYGTGFIFLKVLEIPIFLVSFIFAVFKFTFVDEGTAKAVVRFKGFKKIIMTWEGYGLNKDWDVVKRDDIGTQLPESWEIGGFRLVGIRFVDKVYRYNFRWQDIHLEGGKETVRPHEEEIDYIFVKPDVYSTKVEKAETIPPERIPLTILFLVTLRVKNPHKTLFKSPPNWFENAISRLNALLRNWVAQSDLDTILKAKESAEDLWGWVKENSLIKEDFKEWGIEIKENGIQIRDITMPKEYEEAAALEKKTKFEMEGFKAKMTRASRALMEMIFDIRGINNLPETTDQQKEFKRDKMEKVYQEFQGDPENTLKKYPQLVNLIERQMGFDAGAVKQYIIQGGTGLEGLADIFGSALRGGGDMARVKKKDNKKDDEDEDEDEKDWDAQKL